MTRGRSPSTLRNARTAIGFIVLVGVLCWAVPAQAGTYVVKACGDGPQADGWAVEPGPFVSAFGSCPATNAEGGLGVRNTGGGEAAPGFAAGRTFFTAPAGTRVVRIQGDIQLNQARGWQAGIRDFANSSWLYCGALSSCTTFGTFQPFDIGGFSTPQLGVLAICASGSCPRDALHAYASMKNVTLTLADNAAPGVTITGGGLVAGGWRRGIQSVTFDASDSTGIKSTRVLVDGAARAGDARACDVYRAAPCPNGGGAFDVNTGNVTDGRHTLTVQATDAGDNTSQADRTLLVDNAPPSQIQDLALSGTEQWRSTNRFALSWTNPHQGDVAPIAGLEYELCPSGSESRASACQRGRRDGRDLTGVDDLAVPEAGEWTLRAWLRDEAGNESIDTAAAPIKLRFDDQPPALALRQLDPDDPTLLAATGADTPSGIAAGEIEVQRRGESAWRPLGTTVVPGGLTARIDDESLPDGPYSVRARVADLAGNERSTTAFESGQTAEVALPVRIKTRLVAGRAKRVRIKRRSGGRRYRTTLVARPETRYGGSLRLHGRLTTPGANPLTGAGVEVFERLAVEGAPFRRIGTVTTSKTGRFSFRVAKGPGRVIRLRYPGTKTIRPRNTAVDVRVRASTTMRSNRRSVANGESVIFRGRLRGGNRPADGKLVALQVYSRGKWRTFATPRAGARSGRWAYEYRFDGTRGSVRYRFRARVLREAAYPFTTGTSRQVRVVVRGTRR